MGTEGDGDPRPARPPARPNQPDLRPRTSPLERVPAARGSDRYPPVGDPNAWPDDQTRPHRPVNGPAARGDGLASTPPRGQPPAGAGPAGAASSRRARLRRRVLPRTLLGITSMILAFAIGAGFSGVVLYSYYQYHLDQTNGRVNDLINGYKKQFKNAEGDLQASANAAHTQIQNQLAPLQQLEADPKALAGLVRNLGPSLYFVHTQDVNGQPAVGTAFVVASNSSQSLLLTSATTVAATRHSPGPAVFVRQGNNDTQVSVRTVDTTNDLALIVLPRGRIPVIRVAPSGTPPRLGDKVYAMSGLGSAGAAVSQGAITDVSASGVSTNAPIGPAFQGGPIVNANGEVVAVASLTYAPQGFTSTSVFDAPFPQAACAKVLSCPGGSIAASQSGS